MKAATASALLGALSAIAVHAAPTVDESSPYTGPAVPIGDWVDPTINGNGKGFPRLVELPAVTPSSSTPSNNVNVIQLAFVPQGINIHYQTPFGLGVDPSVRWGTSPSNLGNQASGSSHTYDRTPPCALVSVTQCSQFFHEIQITNLEPGTTYYYQIPAANGTTASDVLSFTTAHAAGDTKEFTVAVLNDMGYTNAGGTYRELVKAVDEGLAFAWHGGDISYADDWYSGILPCADDWPVCYNGTSSELPGGVDNPAYNAPLPDGEVPNQGGPLGGDMSVLYESNWDLWQQWIVKISSKVPYMVMPGNHEASCTEFDGPGNVLTAYLNSDESNTTAPAAALTYFSCPPSQRNFTAYQHRFRMPGAESGGVGNMWYSFDYGLAHFVSIDGETDFANSPEWPFIADTKGVATEPTPGETFPTDSGPFGTIDGSYKTTKNYEQYQWLSNDLAGVDRTKTPWVIVMSHRPMYSSAVSSYQKNLRTAFEALLIQYGVDAYFSGHIHWYERLFPLAPGGKIDTASIINNNTYLTNAGVSMTHIINGMAGNIESHSTLSAGEGIMNITAVLDQEHYGFSKLTVVNATTLTWTFVRGDDGSVGDELTLLKPSGPSSTSSTSSASSTGVPTSSTSSTSSTSVSTTVSTSSTSVPTSVPTSSTSVPTSVPTSSTSASSSVPTSSSTSSASVSTSASSSGTSSVPTSSSTSSASVSTSASSNGTSSVPTSISTSSASVSTSASSSGTSSVPTSIPTSSASVSTSASSSGTSSVSSSVPTSVATSASNGISGGITTTTEVVTAYTTYCPGATVITQGSQTYTVTEATTLTITNCPCTLTHTIGGGSSVAYSTPATYPVTEETTAPSVPYSSAIPAAPSEVIETPGSTPSSSAIPVFSSAVVTTLAPASSEASPAAPSVVPENPISNPAIPATTPAVVQNPTTSSPSSSSTPIAFTGGASRAGFSFLAALLALAAYII